MLSMYVCWFCFSATLYLYEQAVILLSNATGPISTTKSDIKSASFYDAVSTFMLMRYKFHVYMYIVWFLSYVYFNPDCQPEMPESLVDLW